MSEIVLNSGQESAISQIKSWWPSNQRFFVLHGAAGSGKSLITKHIVESLGNCLPLLTAPTNAACRQIEKYFPKEFEVKTTYAALGFHFNQSSEQKYLTRIGVPGFLGDFNLITIDECFHPEVEVLTENGFFKIKDLLDKNFLVANVDLTTQDLSFEKPIRYVVKDYSGKMLYLKKDKVISFYTTENHDFVTLNADNKLVKTKYTGIKSYNRFLTSACPSLKEGIVFDDWHKLALAFQADGSYGHINGNTHYTKISKKFPEKNCRIQFSLSKERKIKALIKICENLGLDYSFGKTIQAKNNINEKTIIYIKQVPINKLSKHLIDVFKLNAMTNEFAIDFINELMQWDGHYVKHNDSFYYSSTIEENVSFVQAVGVLANYKTNKTVQVDDRQFSFSDVHRVFLNKVNVTGVFSNIKTKTKYVNYSGKVYCIEMPKGTLVTRFNGQVSISGNCSFIGDAKKCKLPNGKLISLLDAIMEVDAKVLFIGHKSQLPEVDENSPVESPVFQQGWPRADLTKIERNSGELQAYIEYVESLIYKLNKRFDNKYPFTLLEQIKYIKSPSGIRELKSGHSRIISYRNKTVDDLNISIRNAIFGTSEKVFIEEDNIILTEPVNYIGSLAYLSERNALKELTNKVQFSSNTEFKVLRTKQVFVFGIKCWELEVSSEEEKGLLYSPIDLDRFNEFKQNLKVQAINKVTKPAKDKAFQNYHNLVSLFMTGWKYSYAVTVHRIQGSNVNKPIVLWDDISFCQNVILRHKLLYVACSRAREELLIKG